MSIAIMFAAALVPTIAIVGCGVDYAMAGKARVRLQAAADDEALHQAKVGPPGGQVVIEWTDTAPQVVGFMPAITIRARAVARRSSDGDRIWLSE